MQGKLTERRKLHKKGAQENYTGPACNLLLIVNQNCIWGNSMRFAAKKQNKTKQTKIPGNFKKSSFQKNTVLEDSTVLANKKERVISIPRRFSRNTRKVILYG